MNWLIANSLLKCACTGCICSVGFRCIVHKRCIDWFSRIECSRLNFHASVNGWMYVFRGVIICAFCSGFNNAVIDVVVLGCDYLDIRGFSCGWESTDFLNIRFGRQWRRRSKMFCGDFLYIRLSGCRHRCGYILHQVTIIFGDKCVRLIDRRRR